MSNRKCATKLEAALSVVSRLGCSDEKVLTMMSDVMDIVDSSMRSVCAPACVSNDLPFTIIYVSRAMRGETVNEEQPKTESCS